jgi:cytochrome b involved in lipid metabolism
MKIKSLVSDITLKKLVAYCLVGYFIGVTVIFAGGFIFNISPASNSESLDDSSDQISQLDNSNSTASGTDLNNNQNQNTSTSNQSSTNPDGTNNPNSSTSSSNQNSTGSSTQPSGGSTSAGSTSSSGSTSSGSSSGGSTTSPTPTPTPTPPPTPTPTPPPAPSCGSAGGACTSSEVATHNAQSNCWGIYNGGYYVLTSYVSKHPGGKSVFNSTSCGKDMTAYMNGSASVSGQKRKHSSSAYSVLASYYVGPMK